MNDWLERFDWIDCYRSACRSRYLAQYSPYETPDPECGPNATQYTPVEFPADFENALKHATLIALTRVQRGVIRNLDGFNWIIAPLGAVMTPIYIDEVQDYLDGDCEVAPDNNPPCWCEEVLFEICPDNIEGTLPMAPTEADFCAGRPTSALVPAAQDNNGVLIFPGVAVAECIVRALPNRNSPNILQSCVVVEPGEPVVYDFAETAVLITGAATGINEQFAISSVILSGRSDGPVVQFSETYSILYSVAAGMDFSETVVVIDDPDVPDEPLDFDYSISSFIIGGSLVATGVGYSETLVVIDDPDVPPPADPVDTDFSISAVIIGGAEGGTAFGYTETLVIVIPS
jgi:hypothetical protein